MGWTGYPAAHYKNGKIDRKAEVKARMSNWEHHTILKDSLVGSTWYAAVRDDVSGEVFGFVVLTKVDGGDLWTKEMDETFGPFHFACPKGILKLLTPTDNEQANEWRKNCWQYHEEQKDPHLFKNMPEGTKVKWTVAHDYWTGGIQKGEVHTLTKIKYRKRYYWQLEDRSIIDPNLIGKSEYEALTA